MASSRSGIGMVADLMTGVRWRMGAAALALVLTAGSCADNGSDDGAATTTTQPTTVEDTTTSDAGTTGSGSTSSTTSTTIAGSTSASITAGQTTLPGEEFIGYVGEGDVMAVVGVAHDDVLNLRSLPGGDQPVVATAGPTADDLVASGRGRSLARSIWFEVTSDGTTGWASARFLAHEDGTDDVTAEFLADYGDAPEAETLVDLGQLVATEFASEDPRSEIVLTVPPSIGDLGEVTYDVIGLGDDSVLGFRLHLFAVEDEGGERFILRTIERTTFCIRGTSGEICT